MSASDRHFEQEIELKLRVPSADGLRAIAAASGGTSMGTVQQRNWLFDTADHVLQRARFAVRVRDESGRFRVTAKAPETLAEGGTIATRGEAETEVSHEVAQRLLQGTNCPLRLLEAMGPECARLTRRVRDELAGAPLLVIGTFDNVRERWSVQVPYVEPLVLELDTTTFPNGRVDHELELEIPVGANATDVSQAVRAWLHTAGVEPSPSSSKAGRFYEALAARP